MNYQALASSRCQSRRARIRSAVRLCEFFDGLHSMQPARACFGRFRLWCIPGRLRLGDVERDRRLALGEDSEQLKRAAHRLDVLLVFFVGLALGLLIGELT